MQRTTCQCLCTIVVTLSFLIMTQTLLAQRPAPASNQAIEFRIDTDIYADESQQPINATKTYFWNSNALEYSKEEKRVLSIDFARGAIEVANLETRQLTRINMFDLESSYAQAVGQLNSNQRELAMSSVKPELQNDGYYLLQSKVEQYRFKGPKVRIAKIAETYSDFADWSSRVNSVYPPHKPGLLRMQLDEFLRDQSIIPNEIRRASVTSNGKTIELVARIFVKESLDEGDRKVLSDLESQLQACRAVNTQNFFAKK